MDNIREQLQVKTRSLYFTNYRPNRKVDGFSDIEDLSLFRRPVYKFKDGSSYTGQWNKNNKRDGYGI